MQEETVKRKDIWNFLEVLSYPNNIIKNRYQLLKLTEKYCKWNALTQRRPLMGWHLKAALQAFQPT